MGSVYFNGTEVPGEVFFNGVSVCDTGSVFFNGTDIENCAQPFSVVGTATEQGDASDNISFPSNAVAGVQENDIVFVTMMNDYGLYGNNPGGIGWTKIINENLNSLDYGIWWGKVDATLDLTYTNTTVERGEQSCGVMFVLRGVKDYGGNITPAATGSGANPNPPSLSGIVTTGQGSVVLAFGYLDDDRIADANISAGAGYTKIVTNVSTNAGATIMVAYKETMVATENPGSFTTSGNDAWVATTLSIEKS